MHHQNKYQEILSSIRAVKEKETAHAELGELLDRLDHLLSYDAVSRMPHSSFDHLKNLPDTVLILNDSEEIIFQNRPFAQGQVFSGNPLKKCFKKKLGAKLLAYLNEYRKNGCDEPLILKNLLNNLSYNVSITTEKLQDKNYWALYFHDVSNVLLDQELQKALLLEPKLKEITNELDFFVFILNKELSFNYLTAGVEKGLKYRSKELLNKPFDVLLPDWQKENGEALFRLKDIASHKKSLRFRVQLSTKFGDLLWFDIRAIPDFCKEGIFRGFKGIGRDISLEVRYEEALMHAKEKAEESDKLKSAFLANMSHEIRTPLNGIIGFATMIKQEGLSAEKKSRYAAFINSSSKQLLALINDIVDISKIEAGQLSLSYTHVNLNKLLIELKMTMNADRKRLGRDLVRVELIKTFDGEDLIISSDEIRLRQVLLNLLTNSLKFTESGSISFGYQISTDGKGLEFFVKDTGTGISKKDQKIIFDRFGQGELAEEPKFRGTGLGLAISKGIVELLGGSIKFQSKLGQGTEFMFTIPLKLISGKNFSLEEPKQQPLQIDWSNRGILVVEDDEVCREFVKDVLKPTGVSLVFALQGEDAVRKCKKDASIDLVLMDMRLPKMNGYQATRRIKEIRKNLPVIAQTANVSDYERQKAFESGCVDFISKPIEPNRILSVISKYLK